MILATIITDWIQAVATTLGVPAALFAIWKLIKENKEQQNQINSLTSLAKSQATMIDKISEQITLEKQQHLRSIRPFFNLKKDPVRIEMNGVFRLEINNTGARAKFKGFVEDFNKTVEFVLVEGIDQFIETGMGINMMGKYDGNKSYSNYAFYGIFLMYEDVEGNAYYQQLIKQSNGHFIKEPILYIGNIEDNLRRTIGDES